MTTGSSLCQSCKRPYLLILVLCFLLHKIHLCFMGDVKCCLGHSATVLLKSMLMKFQKMS
uniref:Uncharacterized protein n=1 Tax=Arundo donax TaxID=35708 RepID=A0A0A9GPS4_ARUDO